jgi:hypothetical protein
MQDEHRLPEDLPFCLCHFCGIKLKTQEFLEHIENNSCRRQELFSKMECCSCGFKTSEKQKFLRHVETKRHEISMFFVEKLTKYKSFSIADTETISKYGEDMDLMYKIPDNEKEDTICEYEAKYKVIPKEYPGGIMLVYMPI